MKKLRVSFLHSSYIFLLLFVLSSCSLDLKKVREGDIVFQNLESAKGRTIQLITQSAWNHCGVVLSDSTGKLFVLEAVDSVRETPLKNWVKNGEGKHFIVMRVKNDDNILTKAILGKMRKIGAEYIGKDYDDKISWSDQQLYSSELVYKVYYRTTGIQLAVLKQLKDFDLSSEEVKQKLRESYKGKIPLTEPVVSSQQLLESTWLLKVMEH